MNLFTLNLNLLTSLQALLNEQHVSRAAEKSGITQAAMSNTLKQLRSLFNDPLLVRSGKEMQPTPLALAIQPELNSILEKISNLVAAENTFDPKTSDRTFEIGMIDVAEMWLMPNLIKIFSREAPKASFQIHRLSQIDNDELFQKGKIDLGIGITNTSFPNTLEHTEIGKMGAMVVGEKKHPLMKGKMTLNSYLKAKQIRHCYTSKNSKIKTQVDKSLEAIGKKRNIIGSVSGVYTTLFSLKNSNLIATLPDFLSEEISNQLGIVKKPVPFPFEKLEIFATWLPRYNKDPAHKWLRNCIQRCAKKGSNIPQT